MLLQLPKNMDLHDLQEFWHQQNSDNVVLQYAFFPLDAAKSYTRGL